MDHQDGSRETFETRFATLAAILMRALERRRDRAMHRAGALFRPECDGGMDAARQREHQQWLELHRAYERAHDGVHAALVFVRSAAEILRRLRDTRGERE